MAFIAISIDDYIKKYLANNPNENEAELRKNLNSALADYKKGLKCDCGNDLWVIGSAAVGNSCFSCITGEAQPSGDYELEDAIKKREIKSGRRHIDDMDPTKIAGIFDDDGYEINAAFVKKPALCLTCRFDDDPNEELLCLLNRNDQKDDEEFICGSYQKKQAK
jgi:hypothetical protein